MTEKESGVALVKSVRESAAFLHAPQRLALFNYLWEHRASFSRSVDIWEEALEPFNRSRHKNEEDYDFGPSVRERIHDLRGVLLDHFADVREGWRFEIPDALPALGYQLQLKKVNDPHSATWAFWRPHLASQQNISVVYIEQLFFNNWDQRFVFRYYDCNEERSDPALTLLRERHPEVYEANRCRLHPAYPYVAWGEVEALGLITRWFSEHAVVKVNPVIPRRLRDDDTDIWEDSLIMLGTAPGNSLIAEVLGENPHLPIRMEEGATVEGKAYGRVVLQDPTDQEMRLLRDFHPVCIGSVCTLDFSAAEGFVLVILTRVSNRFGDSTVTILNADFGRAVEQLALLLTDEERMRAGTELPANPSEYFQALFSVPIRSLTSQHRRVKLKLLAYRPYAQ